MQFKEKKGWRGAAIVALALLCASGIAFGQAQTGNLYVKATDEQGGALPGVSVTLSGPSAPITQVTNVNGEVRFLNLAPNVYILDFALQGFQKIHRTNVTVSLARNTELPVTMKLAGVQESIVVAGESPLLDTKKTGSTATVSQVELQDIPSARDPWVVLAAAPGVMTDRVNVGGSESGQQAVYIGKGAATTQGTWNVDGVNITDMAATGSSAMYWDFDSFAELNFSTGGADASISSPGVQLNMVTKRGTNDVHGSARFFYEDKNLASTNTPEELTKQTPGGGNQVNQLQDYGIEVGGPVIKDMLWLWGSANQNYINLQTAGGSGATDVTTLKNFGAKLNFQPIPENSFSAQYLDNNKIKLGRNAGPQHPPPSTWNQNGPDKLYKLEDSEVFSANVFATATYARVMGGFSLLSVGRTQSYVDSAGVYTSSYLDEVIQRPQTQFGVTPSFFLRTGNVGHEIKAGFQYRHTPYNTIFSWPQGIKGVNGEWAGAPYNLAGFTRPQLNNTDLKTYNGFVSDTMTIDRLTVNVGVRYDYQWGENAPGTVPLGEYDPAVWPQVPLTALDMPGTPPLTWKDWSPRVGLTYALGPENKTILQASYARFVNQMGGNSANVGANSYSAGIAYLYYEWHDANTNRRVDPGEVNFNNLYSYYNWDPAHPNSVTQSINKLNYDQKTPKTDEFILGVQHELMPAFVVGVQGTYRHMTDFLYNARLSADGSRILTPADFTCTQVGPWPVPHSDPQYVQQCVAKPGAAGVSTINTNRPGYYQNYWGVDFSAEKRYSDKWMGRFNFTWNNWTQHGIAEGQVNPANLYPTGSETEGGALTYSGTTSGGKGYVFVNAPWVASLTGMYTLPYDFNISTNIYTRSGYPAEYYRVVSGTGIPGVSSYNYQLGATDLVRLPTVFEWDLGISKVVKVGPLAITLQADCFNVLNRNTPLQRTSRIYDAAGTPTPTDSRDSTLYEIQSPRIFRFGARLAF